MENTNHRMHILVYQIIKYVCVLCMVGFVLLEFTSNRVSKTDFDTMSKAIEKAVDVFTMELADNQRVKRFYGLDPAQFENVLFYCPTSNMGAEELLLIQLKDVNQAESTKEAIEKRLATQKKNFDGYGTYQTAMLNEAQIVVKGNYILFISSENPDKVVSTFNKNL